MGFVLCFEVEETNALRLFSELTNQRMNEGSNANIILTGSCWIQELTTSLMLVVIIENNVPVWIPFRKNFFKFVIKKGLKKQGYRGAFVKLKNEEALRRLLKDGAR